MADARLIVDINGINYYGLTYQFDSTITFDKLQFGDSAQAGLAVVQTGNGIVGLTVDASAVHGKLLHVEPDVCTVQIDGGCKLPGGAAATLTPGSKIVGAVGAAAAKGFIRSVAPAALAEVAVARHQIHDASDPTNVQVWLD